MPVKLFHSLFVLFTSIPISMINFSAYLKGVTPSVQQMLFTALFIILWAIYGFAIGMRGVGFVKFLTYYWGIGMLLCILGGWLKIDFVAIPALIIYQGPLYGLHYFYRLPSYDIMIIINTLIVYALSLFGYYAGRRLRHTTSNKNRIRS